MNELLLNILLLAGGLAFLVKGSDFFVNAAASVAKKKGISEFVIGLTLVAVGTSIPELASSLTASLKGSSGLVIGNVVGSNIANIGLIVGLAAILGTISTKKEIFRRDGYVMGLAVLMFLAALFDGRIALGEAAILLIVYIAYIMFLFDSKEKLRDKHPFKEFISYFFKFKYIKKPKKGEKKGAEPFLKDMLKMALGTVGIVAGAKYTVDSSIFFSEMFNIPEFVVGLTIVAIGTSLPELVVTVSAARKGFGSMAVGNVIGSNIANIFLILGVSGIAGPLHFTKSGMASLVGLLVMTVALLVFMKTDWEITKKEGIMLLSLYVIFLAISVTVCFTC